MDENRTQASEGAAAKAERIAAEGEDVRERTRRTFVDAVSNRDFGLDTLSNIAGTMVDGAVEGVRKASPQDPESVLRKVIDGLADGFSSTANATRLAIEEAKGRGETFAREDLERVSENLRTMERTFVDTVSVAAKRGREELGAQLSDLEEHARRAASHLRPALEDALHAAMNHPVQFAKESAATGARAVPQAAGMLLKSVSGLLQGAGDLLAGSSTKRSEDVAGEETKTSSK